MPRSSVLLKFAFSFFAAVPLADIIYNSAGNITRVAILAVPLFILIEGVTRLNPTADRIVQRVTDELGFLVALFIAGGALGSVVGLILFGEGFVTHPSGLRVVQAIIVATIIAGYAVHYGRMRKARSADS